jgi:Tol biopolymer transport system component
MSFAALFTLVLAMALHPACNCDEVLASQSAEAELGYLDDRTPPVANLDVRLGPRSIGSTADVTIELHNVGTLPLVVTSAALISDPLLCPQASGEFTLTGAPPSSVATGASAPLTVRFAPQHGAPACTVLAVDTNDSSNPRLTAVITGQGDAGALCTDRTVIDFGDVVVGDTKDDVVTLRSCGTRAVTIVGLVRNDFFPPFALTDPAFGQPLEPNATFEVPVQFLPTTAARHSVELGNQGLLDVPTDLLGQLFQIALVGNGKNPPACVVDVVPSLLQFGFVPPNSVVEQSIIVRNLGELPCNVTSAVLRDGAGEFTMALPVAVPFVLEPFSVLQIPVTFTAPDDETTADNAFVLDSDDPLTPTVTVPIEGAVPSDDGCFVNAVPSSVDFGAVQLNTLRARAVTVTNVGQDPCFINDTAITNDSDPGFIDASTDFGAIFPGASRDLAVAFRPTTPSSSADGTFEITVSDSFFAGTTTLLSVPLSAFTGDPGLCVVPRHLDFGEGPPSNLTFTVSACGAATVTVTELPFTIADSEFSLVAPLVSLPRTLAPGQSFVVTVRYAGVDEGGDTAEITVVSNDLVAPEIPVTLTGGHTIVPPDAGRYLYYWSIPSPVGGDILKLPLQGDVEPQPFWGPRNGKGCAGCHSISPDGRYVAVVEVGSMRFVEAETNVQLFLGDTELLNPTSFSWRPNVNTDPPYQYVYSNNVDLIKASLFDGPLGTLPGADDDDLVETMPTWGRDGTIAFVRGTATTTTEEGSFGLSGPTDIMLIGEDGGTAVGLVNASGNGFANYYPSFSPNGLWIAFTQSESATSTVAAEDANIRLARSDNTGAISTLPSLNAAGGPSSYTTWSVDGRFLSFSSIRDGGQGNWDIYLGTIDPDTGADSELRPLSEINTSAFEHGAIWSP